MHARTYVWLLGLGICLVLITSTLSFYSSTHADTRMCDDPACSYAKMTQFAINLESAVQTAQALPTRTPVPTNTTPVEITPPPLPAITIKQIADSDLNGPLFGEATTAWLVGVVASSDPYDSVGVFVVSYPPGDGANSSIRYALQGRAASKEDQKKYAAYWFAPKDVGEIHITGVTGIDGTVSFTTTTGVVGTCDLAKGIWSLH